MFQSLLTLLTTLPNPKPKFFGSNQFQPLIFNQDDEHISQEEFKDLKPPAYGVSAYQSQIGLHTKKSALIIHQTLHTFQTIPDSNFPLLLALIAQHFPMLRKQCCSHAIIIVYLFSMHKVLCTEEDIIQFSTKPTFCNPIHVHSSFSYFTPFSVPLLSHFHFFLSRTPLLRDSFNNLQNI